MITPPPSLEHLRRSRWHGGQLLAFSGLDGPTDYARGLVARTAFDHPGLEFRLPGRGHLRFELPPNASITLTGDAFWINAPGLLIRGAFLNAHHLLVEGPCAATTDSPDLLVISSANRTLVASAAHAAPALLDANLDRAMQDRLCWMQRVALPGGLAPATRRTLAKALALMKTQVYTPEGAIRHRWTTPDRWPHRAMWLWDSVFHAIGLRHLDPTLARDAISAVLDTQRADGFVAHRMDPAACSAITQPPVLALGVRLVQDVQPDRDWLAALFPKLGACVEWDLANRDSDGAGLAEWFIEGDPHCRSGESGMDNSPRFDSATRLDAVDFNAYLALECETLAGFATELDRHDDARRWSQRHAELCDGIRQRLWSEESLFFVDYDVDRAAPSTVLSSAGFLPLICGAATPRQAAQLAAHLHDPTMFGTPLPVPSIAARDTAHYAKDMWRGPVWINVNWFIARGLDRYGLHAHATQLRRQTTTEIERCCERYGTFFEFYDDRGNCEPPALLRKGRCAPAESPLLQVFHDYGWTATLYTDMVLGAQ